MNHRDIERDLDHTTEVAGEKVRQYANGVADRTHGLLERGKRLRERLSQRASPVGRRLTETAGELSDKANHQVRRLGRQVQKHPVATAAIVAGTVGALLLLRRALRTPRDEG